LFTGDAPAAIVRLERLVKREPAYAAAQFKLAAACCCDNRRKEWLSGIDSLLRTPLGNGLPVACRELACDLVAAGQLEYARRLVEGTLAHINDDDALRSLLEQCRPGSSVAY